MTRREQLKTVGAAALGAMATGIQPARSATASSKRVVRFAQITDTHVQPELGAADGFRQCLRHIHGLEDRPQFIINTGDAVMDCMGHDEQRCTVIWDVWQETLASDCKLPVYHLIGNHDVWGWNKKESQTTGSEVGWGKELAMQRLGLKTPYYSFNTGGWHFIALDTVQPHKDFYLAGLDEVQFQWLQTELESIDSKTPVVILSHIPILTAAALMKNDIAQKDSFVIPGGKMLLNNVRMKDLLKSHSNVRLCISGHIHLLDRVQYLGVTYLCNGAVCGNYWKDNSHGECEPGYSIIDLFDDGSFEHQYIAYGWQFRSI